MEIIVKKDNMENRTCKACKIEKPLTDYYVYKKTGEHWVRCKRCHYELNTKELRYKWRKENPEREKEILKKAHKKWRASKPEAYIKAVAKANKKYYAKNKEKIKQRNIERKNGN